MLIVSGDTKVSPSSLVLVVFYESRNEYLIIIDWITSVFVERTMSTRKYDVFIYFYSKKYDLAIPIVSFLSPFNELFVTFFHFSR